MQLDYHILWFEDQLDQVQAAADRIRDAVVRLGFIPKITFREVVAGGPNPTANLPNQMSVDLVLMDWKLGGGQTGDELSRRIRNSYRDTDIVFYSSETQERLRDLIHNQNIDGVRCINRPHLSDRVIGIIHSQLRRILDLNHMRGIVMAATSDLDHEMLECLKAVQKINYPNSPEVLAASIAAQIVAQLQSKAKAIQKFGDNGRLDKLLEDPAFGAALRHTALQTELQKLADQINETHLLDDLRRYPIEVIKPRNAFAHRRAEVVNGVLEIAGYADVLDQSGMTALRLRLTSHHSSLGALLTLLREMATAAGETGLADHINIVEQVAEHVAQADATLAAEEPPEAMKEKRVASRRSSPQAKGERRLPPA